MLDLTSQISALESTIKSKNIVIEAKENEITYLKDNLSSLEKAENELSN